MLKDRAYELIKQRLFELDLVSGQFVTQRQISELIEVPLGPVREAMHRLQSEGLVTILPQRGIRISPVDERLVRDAFQLRRLLEIPGIRALARNGDRALLRDLRRRTKEILKNETRGTLARLSGEAFAIDQRLHEAIVDSLGNRLVSDIYRIQQDRLRLIRLNVRISMNREPGLEEHVPILDALLSGDAETAEGCLVRHIDNTERRAIDALSHRQAAGAAGTAEPGTVSASPAKRGRRGTTSTSATRGDRCNQSSTPRRGPRAAPSTAR